MAWSGVPQIPPPASSDRPVGIGQIAVCALLIVVAWLSWQLVEMMTPAGPGRLLLQAGWLVAWVLAGGWGAHVVARRLGDLERRLRASENLVDVCRAVSLSLDRPEAAQTIADSLPSLLAARSAVVYHLDPRSGDLEAIAVARALRETVAGPLVHPKGTGVAGLAVSLRRPVQTPDVLADPRIRLSASAREWIGSLSSRAVLALPLMADGEVIGALGVGDDPGRRFDDADVRLAELFATQAVIVLRNARLYRDAQRRLVDTESLAEVGRLISQSLDPAVVHQRIVESLRTLLGAAIARVYRLDTDGSLVGEASVGPAWLSGTRLVLPPGMGAVGLAVATRGPVVCADLLLDPGIPMTADLRTAASLVPYRATLAVPLVVQGRAIGALVVGDEVGRRFSPEEVHLAEAFASQAAVAFENARLHAETERRRDIAERLAQVGRVVSESLEPHVVARRIVDSVCRLADAKAAVLCRLDPGSNDLVSVATTGEWGEDLGGRILFPRGTSASGLAVAEHRVVVSDDILSDPRIQMTADLRRAVERADYRAVVAVPLIVQGRVVGTLGVGDRAGRRFGPEETEIVETFAGEAAAALDRARLFAELQQALARLTVLSRRLLDVQEDERRQLARDLHDEVGQLLTGLELTLASVTRLAPSGLAGPLAHAQSMVLDLIRRVREMAVGLRPPMLDDLGLVPALVWHVGRFTRQTSVEVKLTHAGLDGRRLPPPTALVAYRIVQEALTNVARHSGALQAAVRVTGNDTILCGEVEDQGAGYEPGRSPVAPGIGLAGMRERAEQVGGKVCVTSAPGAGTRVTFELPLPVPSALSPPAP